MCAIFGPLLTYFMIDCAFKHFAVEAMDYSVMGLFEIAYTQEHWLSFL